MVEKIVYHGARDKYTFKNVPPIYGYVDKRGWPFFSGTLTDDLEHAKVCALRGEIMFGEGTVLEIHIPEDKLVLIPSLASSGHIYATTDRVRTARLPMKYLIHSFYHDKIPELESWENKEFLYFYIVHRKFIKNLIPVIGYRVGWVVNQFGEWVKDDDAYAAWKLSNRLKYS